MRNLKVKSKVTDFRKELLRIMPGYKWTIRRKYSHMMPGILEAEGIQTSGFNRLSTLNVIRRENDLTVQYEVRSSGFGKNSRWIAKQTDSTLASALRNLQNHYEGLAALYSGAGRYLQNGRKKREG